MIGLYVWWPERPEYGLGVVKEVDTYKEYGLEAYQSKHYKVFFQKKKVYVTIFKRDLIILKESDAILYNDAK